MADLNALVRSQQTHAQVGGDFIGSLVWWSLNGNRVSHVHLKDLADKHGLPEHYLPTEVKPASAFRRAWRHAATKQTTGLLLRQIDETPTGIHIGLVQERADSEAHQLAYDHLVTIAFSKEHHMIQASEEHPAVHKIEQLYEHHLELTTRDIRAMLSNFVNEAGVSLRESGGVYFIASPHQETIDAMAAVLQSIGHNHLHQLPLYDSPHAQDVLNGVTMTTLDEEIHKLADELEAFMADDKTRKSTLHKRIDAFDSLRARVNTFAGVLSFKSDALLDKVCEMETELRQHLGLSESPTAQPTPSQCVVEQDDNDSAEQLLPTPRNSTQPSKLPSCAYDPEAGF